MSKKKTQTHQKLTAAFWQLYCQKRIDKITVHDITTLAGYNRSTFYQYFQDVYDVLEQLELSLLPSLAQLPTVQPSANPEKTPINQVVSLFAQHREYYAVLLGENGNPAFAHKLKVSIKQTLFVHVQPQPPLELDYALEYTLSALIGTLTYWFENNENLAEEKLLAVIQSLINPDGMLELAQNLQLLPIQSHQKTER
ncbi:MAG: TetR/AcrR family transcriptional regulator [Culicoidibacterales bacterium]